MPGESGLFDFAAEMGLTKHMGRMQATERLVKLCRIGSEVRPLVMDEWPALMPRAGLEDCAGQAYAIDAWNQARQILRRYGRAAC